MEKMSQRRDKSTLINIVINFLGHAFSSNLSIQQSAKTNKSEQGRRSKEERKWAVRRQGPGEGSNASCKDTEG